MPYSAPTHQPIRRKRAWSKDAPGDPFYSSWRWKKVRRLVLNANPLCTDPYKRHAGRPVAATEVDHIIPRRDRPDLTYDLAGLQGLCRSCHGTKSVIERNVRATTRTST